MFLLCLFHGHICLHFRDGTNLCGYKLRERYEETMARLQQITSGGYTVEGMSVRQRHPTQPSRTETESCSSAHSS